MLFSLLKDRFGTSYLNINSATVLWLLPNLYNRFNCDYRELELFSVIEISILIHFEY